MKDYWQTTMLLRLMMLFILFSSSAFAQPNFSEYGVVQNFINEMVKKHHFKRQTLEALFNQVRIKPSARQNIKAPMEKQTWYAYRSLFITEDRIKQGVTFWHRYHSALTKAEKIYGVPASLIVATIGVETKYGKNKGNYRVIDALSSIAFSTSPRAAYFKKELEQFLLLTREQHISPLTVMGSYAGAIGQPQFMPSSYRYYAVNFSGNRKIDLSNNEVDVIGSIANYYQKNGWHSGQPVTIPISLHGNQLQFLGKDQHTFVFSQMELAKYGINLHGKTLKDQNAKLLILQAGYFNKEYWLTFHNFNVIKRYNSSDLYAMAVYQLSYYLSRLEEKTHNG